jgi:hypothetical protein
VVLNTLVKFVVGRPCLDGVGEKFLGVISDILWDIGYFMKLSVAVFS